MLPDFLIIGAMKAGTSSLFRYLSSHPEIVPSSVKETDFFFSPKQYDRGRSYYEGLFQGEGDRALEASPNYTKRHLRPGMPEKIHALMPGVKMVYVVRDPVQRLVSHYVHNLDHGRERRTFSEAIREPDSNYILTSRYHFQLEAFLDYFPADQFMILDSARLRDDTEAAVASVCGFFGIPADCDPAVMSQQIHPSSAKTRASLIERGLLKTVRHPGARSFIKRHTRKFRKPISRPVPSRDDLDFLSDALGDDQQKLQTFAASAAPLEN